MSYTPPPPPPPEYGGGQPAPQQNQKALWAMILGILGIVLCGVFAGIPALILGNNAKKEIGMSGGMQTGNGMATAGVVLGWVSIAFTIISILLIAGGVFSVNAFETTG
jgi:putative exporter of polyketide antibiotics